METDKTSTFEEEMEHANSNLFQLIPVIYGAVFSYAMYVLSIVVIRAFNNWTTNKIFDHKYLYEIILFVAFTLYMIEDVGSVIKLGYKYPFKKTSRYTFEIFIALLYICVFSFLSEGIYWSVSVFALIAVTSGVWYNQFKQEYRNHSEGLNEYVTSERIMHYGGGCILLIETGLFAIWKHINLDKYNVGTFTITLLVWMFSFARYLCITHGERVLLCRVFILISDSRARKLSKPKILK
jgi:hypothetical protein